MLFGFSRGSLSKLVLKMKLLAFLMFAVLAVSAADSYSQAAKFSLKLKDATVREVFDHIEENSEFILLYNEKWVDVNRRVDINVKNETVEKILDQAFKGTRNVYKIYDRQVVILEDEKAGIPANVQRQIAETQIQQPQQKEITGTVTDEDGLPLPGVSVIVKGTTIGTVTSADGEFSLDIPLNAETLQFSFVGMKTQEIPVEGKSSFSVVLEEDILGIEEVVAIGYGTERKRDLTGAVSSIRSEELTKSNSNSFAEALQGRIAGVRVNSQSGEPGSSISVQIRGANSINAASSPLYVIDGVPFDVNTAEVATSDVGGSTTSDPLATINPQDIESIEVLKDASSAAIYGARGANGVIIITTKSGKTGTKTTYNLNVSHAISEVTKSIDMLNGQEYVDYRHELSPTVNVWGIDTDGDLVPDAARDVSSFKSHNWQNELFRTGSIEKVNLSMQGGQENTTFSGSFGVLSQKALVENNDYDSYSARFNLDHKASDKISVGLGATWGKSKNTGLASSGGGEGSWSGIVQSIYTFRPILLASPDEGEDQLISLETMVFDAHKETDYNRISGNAYIRYKILYNLGLRVSGGGHLTSSKLSEFYGTNTLWGYTRNGMATLRSILSSSFYQSNVLDYWKKINNGDMLKLMAGFDLNTYRFENFSIRNTDFTDESTGVFDISKGSVLELPYSRVYETKRMSFFGRINYNIKEKYLFTGTFRADGSSNFGNGNRYGYFPSAAFAWRVIEEPFMDNLNSMSNLKLRLSYGETGNDRISPYSSMARLSPAYYPSNGGTVYGAAPTSSANPDLKWETTSQYNAGLDIGMFDNRLTLTGDVYYKKTEDMLLNAEVSSQTGFSTQWRNIGDMENKGLELAINSVNVDSRAFKWNTSFNFYMNRNKILSLGGTEDIPVIIGSGHIRDVGIVREGEPLGTAYGYEWIGIYQIDDFTWQNNSDPNIDHNDRDYTLKDGVPDIAGVRVKPGDFKYKDIAGDDGVVNSDDRKIISNSNPKFAGAISNEFHYNKFSLNLFFEGVYGNEIFNAFPNRVESGQGDPSYNLTKEYWYNRWTPENPSNRYASINNPTDNLASTYYVEDGSYLRFKTLSLAYNFDKNSLRFLNIANLKVYASIDNLHVWTNYSGIDPDIRSRTDLLPGYDRMAYPRARTYTFGLDLTF